MMNCSKCGAILEDGVLFCRECGEAVGWTKIMYCRECGAALSENGSFCSSCGAKINSDQHGDNKTPPPDTKTTPLRQSPPGNGTKNLLDNAKDIVLNTAKKVWTPMEQKLQRFPKKHLLLIAGSVMTIFVLLIGIISLISFSGRIKVADVVGLPYSEAMKSLAEAGFTNVTATGITDADSAELIVSKQSIKAGTKAKPDARIELLCSAKCFLMIHIESEFNFVFSQYSIVICLDGKEIGTVANGETVTYTDDVLSGKHTISFNKAGDSNSLLECNRPLEVSSDLIYSCTLAHSSSAIDIKAENFTKRTIGTLKDELEKWENKEETDQTETEISNEPETDTTAPAEEESTQGTLEITTANQTTATGMPVMPGTNINTLLSAAEGLGLSRLFSDEDFGHDTKMCSLANESNSLTLDIIYSEKTKEILCGTIVTFSLLSSSEEQQTFIKAIAPVLCPEKDKNEVTAWVQNHVGGSSETEINGFIYELAVGPTGNALYYAGEQNWETWDYSLD